MSHSQFHSIRVLILRHAWLNLLDKHMTTGRINQVTTLRTTGPAGRQTPTFGDPTQQRPVDLQNEIGVFPRKPYELRTRASRPPNTPTPRTGVYSASAIHREHCISQLRSQACLSTKPYRRHQRVGR